MVATAALAYETGSGVKKVTLRALLISVVTMPAATVCVCV